MTKIYIDMEPQPEIVVRRQGTTYIDAFPFVEFRCTEPMLIAPYKVGDEMDWEEEIKGNRTIPAVKGIIKSICPANKDGRWQWEIEV